MAIQRAVENLINNAVRYGSAGEGQPDCQGEKQMVIRVEDDGPGIPEDQRE